MTARKPQPETGKMKQVAFRVPEEFDDAVDALVKERNLGNACRKIKKTDLYREWIQAGFNKERPRDGGDKT